jgi:hypothetical protein
MLKRIFLLKAFILISLLNTCFAKTYENIGDYMQEMQKIIKSNWQPSKKKDSYKVISTFKIYKDGSIKDIKISKASPNPEDNKAALEAIYKSIAKIPSFKSINDSEFLEIEFTFDYKIVKKEAGKAKNGSYVKIENIENESSSNLAEALANLLKSLKSLIIILVIIWIIFSRLKKKPKNFKETLKSLKPQNDPKHYDPTNVKR